MCFCYQYRSNFYVLLTSGLRTLKVAVIYFSFLHSLQIRVIHSLLYSRSTQQLLNHLAFFYWRVNNCLLQTSAKLWYKTLAFHELVVCFLFSKTDVQSYRWAHHPFACVVLNSALGMIELKKIAFLGKFLIKLHELLCESDKSARLLIKAFYIVNRTTLVVM